MKCLFLPLFFIFFFSLSISAQNQVPQTLWAARDNAMPTAPSYVTMAKSGFETAGGMVLDANENAYSISSYQYNDGSISHNGVAIYKFTNSTGAKDPGWNGGKGVGIWVEGGNISINNFRGPHRGIAVSDDGSVYVILRVEKDPSATSMVLKYDSSGTVVTLNIFDDAKGVVIKLNSSGTVRQFRSIRQSIGTNFDLSCIETDGNGDVYVSGQFSGQLNFRRINENNDTNFDYVTLGCINPADNAKVNRFVFKLSRINLWPSYGKIIYNNQASTSLDYYAPTLLSSDGNNVYIFYRQRTLFMNIKIRIKNNEIADDVVSGPPASAADCSAGDEKYDGNINSTNSIYLAKMNISGVFDPVRVFNTAGNDYPIDIKAYGGECYLSMFTQNQLTYSYKNSNDDIETSMIYNSVGSALINKNYAVVVAKLDESVKPNANGSGATEKYTSTTDALGIDWIQFFFCDISSNFSYYNQPFAGGLSVNAEGVYLGSTMTGNVNGLFSVISPLFRLKPSPTSIPNQAIINYNSLTLNRHFSSSNSSYTQDIILAKMTNSTTSSGANGNVQWGAQIGSTGGFEYLNGVQADANSNVFLGGYFFGPTDLDPTPVNFQLFAQGSDAFVAKYGCWGAGIGGDAVGCVGEFSTLNALPECSACTYSFQWRNLAGGSTTTGNQYLFSGNLGLNRIELRSTELSTGCVSTDVIEITFNPAVTVAASPALATVCDGTIGSFAASTSITGTSTFNWYDFITGDLVGSGPSFSTLTPGVYKVIGNVNGCEGTQNVSLVNYPDVSPRIAPEVPTLCGAGGSILQVLDCPGCGFVWTTPPLSTAYSISNIITADVTGTYQVGILDQYGCTQNLLTTLTNAPFLTPPIYATNASGNTISSICDGQPLIVQSTAYSDCPTCTYSWSDGSVGPYTFAFNNGTFNVTVTDLSSGCVGTSSNLSLQVSTLTQPIISGDPSTICSPDAAQLEVSNPCINCTYVWRNPLEIFPVGLGLSYTLTDVDNVGYTDLFVEVTDEFGCVRNSNMFTVFEDVVSRPTISTTANLICFDSLVPLNTATLSTINCAGCTYQWFRNDVLIPGATQFNYTTNILGTYKVELTYANSCKSFSDNVISLSAERFQPQIGPAIAYLCNNEPTVIGMEGFFRVPPLWSYQWYRNGVAISGSTGFNHDALTPGSYYVEVTNINGCTVASNTISVQSSTAGANPSISSAIPYLCSSNTDTVTLSTTGCPSCDYDWRNANNVSQIGGDASIFKTSIAQGYFVRVTETNSGCIYDSPVFQVTDTIYPTPNINALSSIVCSTTPVILSTDACVSCEYQWLLDGSPIDTTLVNTFSSDTTGNYSVRVNRDGCPSPTSIDIPISFVTIFAALNATPSSALSICNTDSIRLVVNNGGVPCMGCSYQWIRNGVVLPSTSDTLTIFQGGSYTAVMTLDGCSDTSLTRSYFDVSLNTDLTSTATRICGPTGPVTLSVDSCQSCNYSWWYGGVNPSTPSFTSLGASFTDTAYTLIGSSAKGWYQVRVGINGCVVRDSIFLDTTAALNVSITPVPAHFTICDGSPVQLTANEPLGRPLTYQWYFNNLPISGAITQANLATIGGNYDVRVRDNFGCIDFAGNLNVPEIDPPSNFSLNLNPVSVIPLSYGNFHLDPYLLPVSLHTNTSGIYSSVPQPAAVMIGASPKDTFYTIAAGTGRHFVTYRYTDGDCTFSIMDTIEVLSSMAVDVVNLNTSAPPYESCLFDTVRFILSNFTFSPNQILFPTSSTTFDTVAVSNAGLTQFAGVWSGNINVIVPNGAVTGKVVFRNTVSGDQFQAPFFLVVQNPAVALSLNGVPQPLCSNADTIALSGFPAGGVFAAAYTDSSNVSVTSLINSSNFLVENVSDYNPLNGFRFVKLTYTYTPTYSNNSPDGCPPVIDSLNVQVNNMELDSIEYTPISETESNVPLATLTRLIWPLENRNYQGNYVGTYVTGNNIQANTLPIPSIATSVNDTVIYTFTNGICSNSFGKDVTVWKRPTILDSIPLWVCQSDDTITIGRNAFGLYVIRNNDTTAVTDQNYVYRPSTVANVDFDYTEFINLMNLTSSNGGLFPTVTVAGAEQYILVPAQITSSSTDLRLSFTYERQHTYYTPVPEPTETITYTIADIVKTLNIEIPIAAQINPAILADPIFCQDNSTQQFSGIPNGGQHYLNGDSLLGNLFNPNQIVASGLGGGEDTLTYVFTGNACVDSASTFIVIPEQFSVTITAPNGPDYCRLDAPDTISVTSSNPGIINNAAGVFLVNAVISGQLFNPAQSPAALNANIVVYIAQDTFGCTATDTANFNVNPMPALRMTSLSSAYCLNVTPFPIDLFEDTIFAVNWHLQTDGYNAPNIQVSLTGGGVMPAGLMPVNPMYSPLQAGPGFDTVFYTFTNTATGCATTISRTTFIKPLPALTLTTSNGNPLDPEYCERDIVPVFASPAGGSFLSLSTNNPGGSNFNTTLPPVFYANIPFILPATATEIIGYTYQDPVTFCRDTIRDTILIRNFTTDATIIGLPDQICADDTIYVLNPGFGAGPAVTGAFGSLFPVDSAMISNPLANTGNFNPYLSGIYDTGRDVVVTYTYSSNNCTNTVYDTATLNPLPQLSFLMPGDTIFNSTDPVFHICFSAPTFGMIGFNRANGVTSVLPQDSVFGGDFYTNSGFGIQYAVQPGSLGNWNYVAPLAQSGLDTINFVYTSPPTPGALRGCTNTISEPIVVDTVPELGFAGFDPFKLDTITNRFVYCANDMPHLVIPSPFGGATYWNYNPIPSILFELRPDTLVVGGQTTIHRLSYEFISARYQGGGVCIDSTIQFVEVRPTPILNLATTVPDFYCVSDSTERIILSATPSGGVFEDISNQASGGIVIGGIVSDSLFDPMAQMGRRIVMYYYTDTAALSGCTDTISKTIDVYNLPDVAFESGGGCVGDAVLFQPNQAGLSNSFPAIDSITMAIWNYGDGTIDTVTTFPNQILVPDRTHIYTTTGVYFPTLTLVNRGTCDTSFTKRIVVSPKVVVNDTTPYFQDFQASPGDWFQDNELVFNTNGVDSLWEWGLAAGTRITTLQESNLVWATDLDSSYISGEKGWVLSPCFDIGTLRRPMVALDIWRDTREGVDGVIMQYFDPPSQSWMNLGVREKGINWYNPSYVIASPGDQAGAPIGWSGISNSWEDARYRLDVAGGDLRAERNLRLRLAFASSPNSVVENLEGFAFDNFYIGNRTRSVLLEHFTNQSYSGMSQIETDLYSTVYDNLYGRDVNLVQYHTEYNSFDYLHQQSLAESNSRVLYYGINNADQIRINGQSLLSRTSDLVNGGEETLDMQMLQDAKFKIRLYPVSIQQGNMTITADVSALEDISYDDYALHVVVTEDSIESFQSHNMMSVLRTMRPNPSGTTLPGTWVAGDLLQVANSWDFGAVSGITYNPNNLKVVVFVQNRNSKEVYQVATSRNLNIFNGPVSNVDEIAMEEGKEILDMNLYPNPTQNYFNVEFSNELKGEYDWKVVDVTGRVLKNGRAESGTRTILVNTENFSPGIYIFSINNKNVYAQRKVIIAR